MSRIIIQKIKDDTFPYSMNGLFFVDLSNNDRFIIDKDTSGNVYNFYLYDLEETKWHFKNIEGYPNKIYCFSDTYKLLKWAGEQGIELFKAIELAKRNQRCGT